MSTKKFNSFTEFEEYYTGTEYRYGETVIVDYGDYLMADGTYNAKSVATAVRRFVKDTEWSWVLGEIECSAHSSLLLPDCDSVAIEIIDDSLIYICARMYK